MEIWVTGSSANMATRHQTLNPQQFQTNPGGWTQIQPLALPNQPPGRTWARGDQIPATGNRITTLSKGESELYTGSPSLGSSGSGCDGNRAERKALTLAFWF